ncbi:MAG: FHA domain-containing protein [Archangiaceae bacterium]|nr:FHA domain-containing protein [Archangiaceae bacterium]
MPIDSPAGYLYTLEEMVASARAERDRLERKFTQPVLLVVAPAEDWAETTAVRLPSASSSDAEPISVTMMPTLVLPVSKRHPGSTDVTFGRSTVCDVVLPFAAISKAHGFFRMEVEGRWLVGDLGSKNGTFVDGHKVTASTSHPMRDGATLRFGDVTAKFLSPVSFVADLKRRLT